MAPLSVQGVVELVSDVTVCRAGDMLTSNQAALLRVFEVKMAAFHMYPIAQWQAEGVSALIQNPLHKLSGDAAAAAQLLCAEMMSPSVAWHRADIQQNIPNEAKHVGQH